MKKSFVAAIATLALVACQQEVTVVAPDNSISFANAFVDHTPVLTRTTDPTITKGSITGFNVWAYMDTPSVALLDGDDVEKNAEGVWTYRNTQYWAPDHTYYFAALAPMDSDNWTLDTSKANSYGAGEVTFNNLNGTEDLLYSATSVTTPDLQTLTGAGMPAVELTFSHLLSRLQFSFRNGFDTPNYTVEVKGVQMTAPKTGTINLAVENWWDNDDWRLGTDQTVLAFGDIPVLQKWESAVTPNQRLTIPATVAQKYEVTFTVVLYVSDVEAMRVEKKATLTNVAFQMGKSYNITTEITPKNLGLAEIEFDVEEVKTWIEEGKVDM